MSTTPALSQALLEQLDSARAQTDRLFELLSPEALFSRPIPERHRLIFYLGHLEAFDWNLIARRTLDIPAFHSALDKLFEFGIDPPVGQAPQDQPSDWPSEAEVRAYNQRARTIIDEVLGQVPEQFFHVALEHRLMHAETLAYLLHSVPYRDKLPMNQSSPGSAKHITRRMIEIPAGVSTLGQEPGAFGWDNEFTEHQVSVPAFAVDKYKVTNGEYLNFVRTGAAAPHFWTQQSGQWHYRGMFAKIPLPLNAPVYVTHAEATAYAKWARKKLLTEAQFHRAAFGTSSVDERRYPWGAAWPETAHGNFDFHEWDPIDVDANPAGESAFGVSQLTGNGWEWTATQFGPFPGFEPFPFYPGYSKDFFDEEHYVLKGGSPRTAACMLRRSFRNWFRPNYPYVYATFRLVED